MVINKKKQRAVLDASFYIHLIKLELIDIFLTMYSPIVCSKVKSEILFSKDIIIYKPLDIKIFEKLEKKNILIIKNPKVISKRLKSEVSRDSGELYSIALAQELNSIVFIDNGRPFKFCKKNNIMCGNIIELLLYLYQNKIITYKDINKKINIIKKSIPKKYLEEVLEYLNVNKK